VAQKEKDMAQRLARAFKKMRFQKIDIFMFLVIAVALLPILSSLLSARPLSPLPQANPAQPPQDIFIKEYKIGPKDLLEIRVLELPELSNITVRVSEDGSITLPLLRNVRVEGLTKDDVERRLAGLLSEKYVNNPQVSVFIKEYQSKRVALMGAVDKPGMYEIIGRLNLLQLITEAGGLKENASKEINVLREGKNGVSANLTIDLDELFIERNSQLNIPLQPNDVVYVPADKIINVYVFGEVKNPGVLQVKMSENITLLRAIAQAGGPTENASKSKVTIKRIDKNGKEHKTVVNLKDIINFKKPDIPLQEGDVIFVPESIF
jgi:polysaccharide export outer membrane protein